MRTLLRKSVCASALGWMAQAASAHEGHGLPGAAHWHATDVLGFVAAGAALLGMALWSRRK